MPRRAKKPPSAKARSNRAQGADPCCEPICGPELREPLGANRGPSGPRDVSSDASHEWIARKGVFAERTACAWLIRRFIDPRAIFRFVDKDADLRNPRTRAFGVGEGTFLRLIDRYGLARPGLKRLSQIVYAGCNEDGRAKAPEAWGLAGILSGLRRLGKCDAEIVEALLPVYDALHVHCVGLEQEKRA